MGPYASSSGHSLGLECISKDEAIANAIDTLMESFLYPEELRSNVFIPRFRHRVSIIQAWNIPSSYTTTTTKPLHVLDIGCGQGESTVTLAVLLGPDARITGIDTARPDYGGPYTVSETHAHVAASAIGSQVSFWRTEAASYLLNPRGGPTGTGMTPKVDAVTLCHSLWYFPTTESVTEIFKTLAKAGVPRVYLAEYAFTGSLPGPAQQPHILAARAQALLHAYKTPRDDPGTKAPNVRAALDVGHILDASDAAGYSVVRQGKFVPAADMIEGHLEARYVVKDMFAESVRAEGLAPEQEEEIMTYVPQIKAAFEKLAEAGIEKGRAMDVWWAQLELKGQQS